MNRFLVAVGIAAALAFWAAPARADTTYRVQPGDSNWGIIAFRNETTVLELLRANAGRAQVRDCREGERGVWFGSDRCRVMFVKVGDEIIIPDSRDEIVARNAALTSERDRLRQERVQLDAALARETALRHQLEAQLEEARSERQALSAENERLRMASSEAMPVTVTAMGFLAAGAILLAFLSFGAYRREKSKARNFAQIASDARSAETKAMHGAEAKINQWSQSLAADKLVIADRENAVAAREAEVNRQLRTGLEDLRAKEKKLEKELRPVLEADVRDSLSEREEKLQIQYELLVTRERELADREKSLNELHDELNRRSKALKSREDDLEAFDSLVKDGVIPASADEPTRVRRIKTDPMLHAVAPPAEAMSPALTKEEQAEFLRIQAEQDGGNGASTWSQPPREPLIGRGKRHHRRQNR